jgi:hypothetical protein
MLALANIGGQGKEMWVNLTGGNNIINYALQLAATLSGKVARLYYTQAADKAANKDAEKCILCPREERYWVELPLMPLNLTPVSLDIIQYIEENPGTSFDNLKSKISGEHWKELQSKDLQKDFLTTLWKQGLIISQNDVYSIGPRWDPIKPYAEPLEEIRQDSRTLEKLSTDECWINRQRLILG